MTTILAIPAGHGYMLYLKEFEEINNKFFIKYRTSYNDIPFTDTEIFLANNNKNFVITGEDGTVLWRFPVQLVLQKLKEE